MQVLFCSPPDCRQGAWKECGKYEEVFATSLHYAPCGVDGRGFQVAIVLPQGTNYPLQETHQKVDHGRAPSEDALLAATNKWLIGHAEGGLSEGSFIGLIGENLDVSK